MKMMLINAKKLFSDELTILSTTKDVDAYLSNQGDKDYPEISDFLYLKSQVLLKINEELDYVNAELDIIGSNKKEFLQNTDAAYNMHIKTKLLGYDLDYNFDIFDNSQKISNIDDNFFATIDNYKFQVENINSKDDIIKLAQLEQNSHNQSDLQYLVGVICNIWSE